MSTRSRLNPPPKTPYHLISRLSRAISVWLDDLLIGRDKVAPDIFAVRELTLTLPRLDAAFDGYRIVHLSDLHADTWLSVSRLEQIVPLINAQKPDLIVITGDFVSYRQPDIISSLRRPLLNMVACDGVMAIFGNHDYVFAYDDLAFLLRTSHVKHLQAGFETIRRGDASLHIAGIDDMPNKKAFLDRIVRQMPEEGAAIILMHKPDTADMTAATGRFCLSLSGHTHCGQIVLPGIGPLFLPEGGKKYHSGLYRVGTMWQYTTCGLGTADFPLRINCPPEISVLTLRAL